MSLKSFIAPRIAQRLLSWDRVLKRRNKFETARLKSGAKPLLEFFHDPSDPYSQLLQSVIPDLQNRYDVEIVTHLVGPPDDEAAPEREALKDYSERDAARLAVKAGLDFQFVPSPPAKNTAKADARRTELGYYLGGAIYYGGEWYWGLDRLHYLEARLKDAGCLKSREPGALIFLPPPVPSETKHAQINPKPELHFYLSFRSPYTAIVFGRVKALADMYGADIKLRFVLPMVMRDLPVPKIKGKYIVQDVVREARRMGIPFGRVCDPVGRPVERGYSLLPWAMGQGRGFDFAASFLTSVWSQGVDAGSDKGLRKIVEAAGLSWNEAKEIADNDDWRAQAEVNRLEMMDMGIWGVPSFRVGGVITWGQDRLWVIEDELKRLKGNSK